MTIQVEILNPKAKRLLEELANLELIKITEMNDSKLQFFELLTELRSRDNSGMTLDEITQEVEDVRKERYERSK